VRPDGPGADQFTKHNAKSFRHCDDPPAHAVVGVLGKKNTGGVVYFDDPVPRIVLVSLPEIVSGGAAGVVRDRRAADASGLILLVERPASGVCRSVLMSQPVLIDGR
jgi:hypothetical protein